MASERMSEDELNTLVIHGLFSHLTLKDSLRVVGWLRKFNNYQDPLDGAYAAHRRAVSALEKRGLLRARKLTPIAWELLAKIIDPTILERSHSTLERVLDDLNAEVDTWSVLKSYLSEPYSEPEVFMVSGISEDTAGFCNGCLRNARLCICIGAWAGAIAYCSLAMEFLIASILIDRGKWRDYTEVPPMEQLMGEIGMEIPSIGHLTKRLIALINNFRNDSIHPRSISLRPGEVQARTVYDLSTRFMAEAKVEWFNRPK